MKRSLSAALAALLSTTGLVHADAPKVVTDIAPVHGLVSRVMAGVGEPELLVRPGSSPHGYSLRPSDARALSQANLVVWIGDELTPWLQHPIEELGSKAHVLSLLASEGGVRYDFRTGATFEAHDHGDEGHDDHGHDDHGHDDHADHKGHDDHHDDHAHDDHGHEDHHDDHADHKGHDDHHDDHADHKGHDDHHDDHADHKGHDDHHDDHAGHDDHGHDDHAGHDHDGVDPHAWLSPENGKVWLGLIANELAEQDPENAATYQANAAAGQAEIDAVVAELRAELNGMSDHPFVVFHDAYQYFERSFDLLAAGAISLGDAAKPSAARLAEIRATVTDLGVECVYFEPQFNKSLAHTVAEAGNLKELEIDPHGADIDLGAEFYPNLLKSMGASLAACK